MKKIPLVLGSVMLIIAALSFAVAHEDSATHMHVPGVTTVPQVDSRAVSREDPEAPPHLGCMPEDSYCLSPTDSDEWLVWTCGHFEDREICEGSLDGERCKWSEELSSCVKR